MSSERSDATTVAPPDSGFGPANLSARIVAVFDFDHTITPWDTAARFFGWLIRRSVWRSGLVLMVLPVLGPLLVARRTRKIPVRFGVWLATFGVSHEQLLELARTHISSVTGRGEAFIRNDARARIEDHLGQGHEVIVATGCLEVLAREVLLRDGLSAVAVVGSSVQRFLGGMVALEYCFGKRKVAMLAARGFAAPWDVVYSDHQADLPLLLQARKQVLVNPRQSCMPALKAALGQTAKVVSWK